MPTFETCHAVCPTCSARLEPMDHCSHGTVGVCPDCGELVRRQSNRVEVYTDKEANEKAHPEVLAKMRKLQADIRKQANWLDGLAYCQVCFRVAPLIDGECPDCRH